MHTPHATVLSTVEVELELVVTIRLLFMILVSMFLPAFVTLAPKATGGFKLIREEYSGMSDTHVKVLE